MITPWKRLKNYKNNLNSVTLVAWCLSARKRNFKPCFGDKKPFFILQTIKH